MKITEINCKSALSPSGIYGWVYALNPYTGCEHSCRYCYAPNILRIRRQEWGEFVKVKRNLPTVLARELKRKPPGLVGISSVTDPYQPIEAKLNITRYAIELLLKHKFTVSLITKSPLILRDLDLITQFEYNEVTLTITTLDEVLCKILEPNAPPPRSRLKALEKLSNEGLNTYAFIGPLLPTLELQEVPEMIDAIAATGVGTIMVDTLNLKPGIWSDVEAALVDYPEIRDVFYKRLFVEKDYYRNIFQEIETYCRKVGVAFKG
ncbi:MAG: radical SAM protein [Thermoplasmata archaeon]|nr:radical SAM protein [Thermoplasmata archaeon]